VADRDPRDVERIAELEVQVARIPELERKLTELTELVVSLKQKLDQNSRNSHLPPSSDGPGARSSGEQSKGKEQRKRGGQPGHGGRKRDLRCATVESPSKCQGCPDL
jgi:transposase